ncbi:MAG: hypothetical protein IT379_15305 [Deltaproteobacteria bacterium]|nr:hypothetical protein [Deltaproteobacteria bacterium]
MGPYRAAGVWCLAACLLAGSSASARADWEIAYERDAGELRQAQPIVSADGTTVWAAGMEHALATGRFRRRVGLDDLEAVLPDGRGIAVEPGRRAITIAPMQAAGGAPRARARSRGIVGSVVASRDGRWLVTHEGRWLLARRTTDLRVHRVIADVGEDDEPSLVALADGSVMIVHRRDCDERGCRSMRVIPESGGESTVAWAERAHLLRTSPAADVIATVESHERIVVRDGATGAVVATHAHPGGRVVDLAVAPRGDVIAVASSRALAVYRRTGATYAVASSRGDPTSSPPEDLGSAPRGLAFSPDGAWLAAGGDSLLVLRRDGTTRRSEAPPPFVAALPTGFAAGDASSFAVRSRRLGSGWTATPRLLAYWERADATTVTATAHDADEMAGHGELDAWALAVVQRYVEAAREIPEARLRRIVVARRDESGRRIVELLGIASGGCDPTDDYHRFVEDGPWLVHVTLATYAPFAELGPLFTAFLDAPFRAAPSRRARVAMLGRGGCGGP